MVAGYLETLLRHNNLGEVVHPKTWHTHQFAQSQQQQNVQHLFLLSLSLFDSLLLPAVFLSFLSLFPSLLPSIRKGWNYLSLSRTPQYVSSVESGINMDNPDPFIHICRWEFSVLNQHFCFSNTLKCWLKRENCCSYMHTHAAYRYIHASIDPYVHVHCHIHAILLFWCFVIESCYCFCT